MAEVAGPLSDNTCVSLRVHLHFHVIKVEVECMFALRYKRANTMTVALAPRLITDRRIASSFGFSDSHRSFDDISPYIDVGLA